MPDNIKPETDSSYPDFEEKFAPGELTASESPEAQEYGLNRENIPENYQAIFKTLAKKVAMRDMFARIEEVKKAAQQRFYWRGMMDVCWNEQSALWEIPYNGQIFKDDQDTGDIELHYPFNIYQSFGRGFISIVAQIPSVRMEATQVDAPFAQRIASSADALRQKIEAQNEVDQFAEDVTRLFWTDGRVGFYSRWVTDGARFGYDEAQSDEQSQPEGVGQGGDPPPKRPRQPRGGELITPYGVLECKVPINMRSQADFPWRQLSFEIDLTSAKAMYPWLAKRMKGGEPGPGEFNFDRTTRIACTQGIKLLTQSGDTVNDLPTWQRTWFRPAFFAEIEEDIDREWFEDNYPDGAMCAFIGDTYAESRNESMDAHWVNCHPLPGDGQATPSCGHIIVPVQDAVCDMTDLRMETYMKSIPAIWCNLPGAVLQAIAKQKAGPGAHYPLELNEGQTKAQDAFWPEPAPSLPADAVEFSQELFGSIPQFLTGLYPAAMGESDASNDTLGGIKLLGQASKGQAGVAWRAFRKAYAKSMTQLIRIGAYFRAQDADNGSVKLNLPMGKDIDIELEDLHEGNWACVPDGDEAYPNTHAEKVEAYQRFIALAGQSPEGKALIFEPKNLVLGKDMWGLSDLEIPGADSEEKQMAEIKDLLSQPPIPNVKAKLAFIAAALLAQQNGQPSPPSMTPEQQFQTSIPIDLRCDDHSAEARTCKAWINSAEGQQAKRDQPDGFLNVRLHYFAHDDQVQAAQKQQMMQAVQMQTAAAAAKAAGTPKKSPAESIAFKDLGPSGKLQVGKQAGLDLTADIAADLAGETMEGSQQQQDKQQTQ